MFTKWFKKFKTPKQKRIAFIDGDQSIPLSLDAYNKHIVGTNTETHLIKLKHATCKEPRSLRKVTNINKIYLSGFTPGKEVVDKCIAAFIQQSISKGYTHITVVSSDYDFIDIFKMAVLLDDNAKECTFKLIIPKAQGKLTKLNEKIANIEIVKMR